jgi:hypothetical protein
MERSVVQGERSIGFGRAGSFLLMPLGILLAGLGVLCLKGHAIGAAGKVLESAVLPYLLVCLAEALILQFLLWRKKYDFILLPLVLMLCSVGLVEIARLKPELLVPQLRWLCVAQAVLLILLRFWKQIREMLSYPYLLGLTCVVVLGLPMLFGTEIGGSRNWLVFGPFSLQPSEFGKILILFFLAAYLSDHRHVLSLPSMRLGPLCLPPLKVPSSQNLATVEGTS